MIYLIALVGAKHRGAAIEALLAELPHGSPLTLRREPTNRFDANAVQVWTSASDGEVHVGYLKANQNGRVAAWMDTLRRARQSDVTLPATLSVAGGRQPMVEVEL